MLLQKASSVGLAAALAIALASAPAAADPIVLNPNFTATDTAANQSAGINGFFISNWTPNGYASNSAASGAVPQYDNDKAGGNTIVGFLSGPSSSLSQVVQGFITGRTYRISVGADARAATPKPTFTISADSQQILGPTTLTPVDPADTFNTAFTPIQSNTFVAANSFVAISFANASTSDSNATTLLTAVSMSQGPEPVSLAILGVGLIGIGIARRRSHAESR